MTIKQSALIVKFIEGNDNFDNYTSDKQERAMSEHNLSDYNQLIPVWQDCINIIDENSLESRLIGDERQMITDIIESIRIDSFMLRKLVVEFIEWWHENKKYFKK